MNLVEMRDVVFRYPSAATPALNNVSLSIEDGEVIGLAGPTGAGKTTLCMALAGLVPHATGGELGGTLLLAGRDSRTSTLGELLTPLDPDRGFVAVTFQDPESQIVGMTVEEDLAFGLENLGIEHREIDRRITEALDFVSLSDLRDAFPYALSGGQKQRVAIASALVMRPRLLVLDEPTSELDPAGRAEIFALIARLADEGSYSVLIVEHALEDLVLAVERLVIMDSGAVVFDDAPAAVMRNVEKLVRIGIRPPDATVLGLAAEQAGILAARDHAFVAEDAFLAALPQ